MKTFTLTTFYTDDYYSHLENFKKNAAILGLKCDIHKKQRWIPTKDEVTKSIHHNNCKWKPSVIEESLQSNDLILWLDIDCKIEKINYIPMDFDIGIFSNVPKHYKNKVSVGWIWFRNTKNTLKFIKEWKLLLKSNKQDHNAFTKAYNILKNEIVFKDVTDSIEVKWNINK